MEYNGSSLDNTNLEKILKFLHKSEKLKTLLRHSWLSSGRQESVAEHSWRLALLAILMEPEMDKKYQMSKVLKMAVVHDLAEVEACDHHAWRGKLKEKHQLEKRGLEKLTKKLPPKQKQTIQKLWEEYEKRSTPEAKFVKALDKLETIAQHDEADIKTWVKEEYQYNFVHGEEESKYNPVLLKLKRLIDKETKAKIKRQGSH